ncbi:T-cell activation inhibitor, mitochondrial-like [Montipora foliosa]|uniref:T-cell activation inhibitor, mitochondrial-like n=1 Tax=Montipora foliosa TaxID=591990 RepID=UPI0035F1B04E
MFFLLSRLSLKQSFCRCMVTRHLSCAQTKAALKPFYFAVHPDLFGQYPIQRSINEDSLKRLNSYLEDIQGKKPVHPTHLMFYLKNDSATSLEEGSDLFKTVRVSLFSRDVQFTISHILKTCGMLEDLVTLHQNDGQDRKMSVALPYGAPLHWLHVYQQFRDRQTPIDLAQLQKNSRSTLKDFLDKNLKNAKEKQESSKTLLDQNKLLSDRICKELRLRKLKWENGWSHTSCHGSLKNFLKLCHSKQSELKSLHGRTVVFTDWTGIDPRGCVMLNIQDVPEFWLSLFNSLEDYDVLVSQVSTWERRLSSLLGDMQIVFDEESPSILVAVYLNYLYRVVSSLRRGYLTPDASVYIKPGEFKNFTARILSPADSLSLSLNGEFRIPPSIPSELILEFVLKHKQKSVDLYQENERNLLTEEEALLDCKHKLQLASLSKDCSVSPLQMSDCCERLSKQENPDLENASVVVSKYYHVNDDGVLSIPWNWK